MRHGPMKPVHCTSMEKRVWRTLIFQFLLLIFFRVQSASDHCDGRYSAGYSIFCALGSHLYLNRGGEKGLSMALFKNHPALAL